MFWRLGWFLKTLNYLADKDIRETVYQNDYFKNNRWNIAYRMMIWASKNALLITLLLPIIVFLISYTNFNLYDELKSLMIFHHGQRNLGNLNDFRQVIIGTQATILGLVFPLVIGFIGFLIQSRSSHETMWHIYKNTSAFLLVGLSSLSLVLYLAVIELVTSWESYPAQVSHSFGVLVWFVFNIFITAWFLWVTVRFISPKSRMEIVLKYALNEVIVDDIRFRLKANISKAYGSDLLKSNSIPKSEKYQITPYLVGDAKSKVEITLDTDQYLINVHYRILYLALWIWGVQAKQEFKRGNKKPKLSIKIHFDGYKRKVHTLAKSNLRINLLSEFLIQKACKTVSKSAEPEMDTNSLIKLLMSQLEDALKDRNAFQFETSIKDLENLIIELERSLNFENDNQENDNWLLLNDGMWLFGRSMLDTLTREMYLLSEKSAKNLLEDPSYFDALKYFYPHLYSSGPEKRALKVGVEYIQGHYFLWLNLLRSTSVKDKNLAEQQVFDSTLKGFIGSWERWNYFFEGKKLIEDPNHIELSIEHLKNTACMLVQALKYENNEAAEWATDTLIYWYELFSNHQEGYQHYSWLHEIFSPEVIQTELDEDVAMVVFGEGQLDDSRLEKTLISLRNTWEEVRLIVCAYIIQSSDFKQNHCAQKIVKSLLDGERLKPTSNIGMSVSKINSSSDLIQVYLRMLNLLTSTNSFDSWQVKFVERLSSIARPPWVPGRSYSSVGTEYDIYLPFFFKVFAIGLTQSKFNLSKRWMELFKTNLDLANRVKRKLGELKTDLFDENIIQMVGVVFGLDESSAQDKARLLDESLDLILEKIDEEIELISVAAEVSNEKLRSLGFDATGDSFNKSTAPFPIRLFEFDINSENEVSKFSKLTIQDYQRTHVSELEDSSVPINESEWLARAVEERLIISVYQQLIYKVKWKEEANHDFIEMLKLVVKQAQEIVSKKQKPMFFIGPWKLYELIHSAIWKINKNEQLPFQIEKRESVDDSYVCHLNGIEVHRLPFNDAEFSLLVCTDVFESIHTVKFEDNRFVDVSFDESESEDRTKGTLNLEYLFNCEFSKDIGYKFVLESEI